MFAAAVRYFVFQGATQVDRVRPNHALEPQSSARSHVLILDGYFLFTAFDAR